MSARNDPHWQLFNLRAEREGWPIVCDNALDFEIPRLGALLVLWRGLGRGRLMPQRAAVTVGVLGVHLPEAAILDLESRPAPRRYRIRLWGDELERHLGDLTGRFVDEALLAPFNLIWPIAFDAVLQSKAPLRFVARGNAGGTGPMRAEALVAPLAGEGDVPSSLLLSIVYTAMPGRP